jgi:hypothetical protein
VCGAIQFDVYTNPELWPPADMLFNELGIDPTRPTIMVGTITPAFFPHNVSIVEILAEAVQSGALPGSCQILVRLHPQVVDGGKYGDDLAAYRALAARFAFVALDIPSVRRWGTMQPPAKGDMARLAAILSRVSVLVVPASTLALDSAALGTPIVGSAFDGKLSTRASERMFYFTHYRPITESGAIALARSPSELLSAVREAIENRKVRAEARRQLAEKVLGPRDGGAVGRVASAIRDIANA